MKLRPITTTALMCLMILFLAACASGEVPTQPPQPPAEYLANALDWIEVHSVKVNTVNWATVREQALALAPNPQTTADTYPALRFVMEQLGDSATSFVPPPERQHVNDYVGFTTFYPEAVILSIDPGGPADRAGLRVGDVIETINGAPPRQWQGTGFIDFYETVTLQMTVRREEQVQPITVTLEKKSGGLGVPPTGRRLSTDHGQLGYLDLPGTDQDVMRYPTLAQQVMREIDQTTTCGWIIDLRRNLGGDIWSYIAATGPILGEGQVGGFKFLDGTRELWTYESGNIYWDGNRRGESLVEGAIYKLKQPLPPVALLTSRATSAAGELAVVTFQGRPKVRLFGEPTGGSPFLVFHTDLSDGAFIGVSAAFSMDRTGQLYQGSIPPDETVTTDWTLFGTDRDPVILAAADWLKSQSTCSQG